MTSSLFPDSSEFIKRDTRKTRWAIPYHSECLNARTHVLLGQNGDSLDGKSVFDAASHIGTLSYAALQLGANHVRGVDSEARTITTANELFEHHGITKDRYRFEVGDVLEFLEEAGPNAFDTVLCFGMLYYTAEPYRLLKLMCRAARNCVLIDTFTAKYAALTGKDAAHILPNVTDETWQLPTLITTLTQSAKKDYTLPESFPYKDNPVSLTAFPTESLLELWFDSLGGTYRKLDWSAYKTRDCSWRDLMTPDQKKSSHWADVYTAGVRVAYRLDLKS
ncbi:MAG: methyltransferase domain-containing protein [Candidatus Nitronauta litoralis]|uniref:Methyltransferase domain-containing protein n=1 Tax=Candidatus Nitronauta litoralis TaxID=2705533 RepID=A0A7T0BWG0_9BACT|nr:MAG: methyltransferase domain-containing protein [Candidatus Nitronauta litoralis]